MTDRFFDCLRERNLAAKSNYSCGRIIALIAGLTFFLALPFARAADTIVVGSKKFTESYVLGEIARKALTDAGFTVEHRQGIGATGIVWEALKTGAISVYPEYTGTISEEILKSKDKMTPDAMRAALAPYGVGMGGDLGFDDTYALVMRRDQAAQLGIRTIDDLQKHLDLRISLSNEFLGRKDGWKPLSARYGLTAMRPRGIEHGLAYAALTARQIDVTDAYSTDAGIAKNDLVVLSDDLHFFPQYKAVFLYRLSLPSGAVTALKRLEGAIDETRMTRLNAEAEKTKDYALAASTFFGDAARQSAQAHEETFAHKLAGWLGRHLYLVGVSLLFAIIVGIPLGILASRGGLLGHTILSVTGVIQTIPSLALLALLVPVLGISPNTAVVALFLYSLLPIVRGTATGLQDIPGAIRESAAALGLTPRAQLTQIYLPIASRSILSGIKTSAIINVGTATIAALIGAGGLGEPIVSGLSLNDNRTILEGAIPAALLALAVQFAFDGLDRLFIPRGLRLTSERR
jgi:osmoprotectant transport system permease protein